MAGLFQKRDEFIRLGNDAMSAHNSEDALSTYLSAGIESVHQNWRRDIGNKAMSILEFDFDCDGYEEVLVGTDGGQLLVFDAVGDDKYVFKSPYGPANQLILSGSINSINVAKGTATDEDTIIVGADKLYAFQYKDGALVIVAEVSIAGNAPISRLKVFYFGGEHCVVVGDVFGNVYSYKKDGVNFTRVLDFHFAAEARIIDFAIGDVNGDKELEIVIVSEDKHIYFLNPNGEEKAPPFAVKHWITNIDVDKKTERLYIGEFDGTVHIYKYQKERIKKITALKQHGILDLVVMRLFGENSEPQFIIGTSDRMLSIFDSIDNEGDLLWSFTTGTGQRTISATLIDKGTLSLCVGTESCELFKYTLFIDRNLKGKIKNAAMKKTFDQWLDFSFSREQQNVLFSCIDKDPVIRIANYETLTVSAKKRNEILTFQKAAMEMWWNGVEYRWSHRAEGRVYAVSMMVESNRHTVLVASQNRHLLGLNFNDGSREWMYPCNGGVRGVCAGRFFRDVDSSFIVVATMNDSENSSFDKMYDSSIEVLDSSRNPIWGFKNKDWALFVAANDINNDGDFEIFVGTEDKQILAFKNNGVLKWKKSVGSRIRAVTIADLEGDGQKAVVVGSDDKSVYVFRKDGDLLISFRTPHYVLVVKAFDINGDGKCEIITGNEDGFIHVYDYKGRLIWQFETGLWIAALDICKNPLTGEVEIVIGSADKSVYGINQHGILLWQYETDARVRTLTTITNDISNYDIVFGSYSDKDDVYKLTRIDQRHLFNQMQKKYMQYSSKLPEIEKKLFNGEYKNRHTRAFFYLFSKSEEILHKGADDNSDIVVSAVAIAILRHFFSEGKSLDLLKTMLKSNNRKVCNTILCEMKILVTEGYLDAEKCYHFLVSTIKKGIIGNGMTRLTQIDIARLGYRLSSNSEELVIIANELTPLRDKYIIDELHYVMWLLNNDEKFNSDGLSESSIIKGVFKKWIEAFRKYPEYDKDVVKMEAVCNA